MGYRFVSENGCPPVLAANNRILSTCSACPCVTDCPPRQERWVWAYAYLSTGTETEPGFGGLILAAKPEERRQWEEWAAKCNRTQDLIIVDTSGAQRFNFLQWEADRAEEGGGLTINVVALLDEIAKAIKGPRAM